MKQAQPLGYAFTHHFTRFGLALDAALVFFFTRPQVCSSSVGQANPDEPS